MGIVLAVAGTAALLLYAVWPEETGRKPPVVARPAPPPPPPVVPDPVVEVPPVPEPPIPGPQDPPEGPGERGWRHEDDWEAVFRAAPAPLKATCGACHSVPPPGILPSAEWPRIFGEMRRMMIFKNFALPSDETARDLLDWYRNAAPRSFAKLPADSTPSPVRLRGAPLGTPRLYEPRICNVNIADLDKDGKPDVLVCDAGSNTVVWLKKEERQWVERLVTPATAPGHTAVFDADGDGDVDIALAGLGSLPPTDDPTGYTSLILNDGVKGWRRVDLLRDQPRTADVEPADLDGDGDIDLVVGAFGWRKTGNISWLRNDKGDYTPFPIFDKPGVIHTCIVDLNGDGHPDIVALLAQEIESIVAFLNDGKASFTPKLLFEAGTPLYGSSGLQMVDLDHDGDQDILYTNGDALDDPVASPKPYHGVQWLENRGNLEFAWHDIARTYGAYRAVAADLDGDGDLDIPVASLFAFWNEPGTSSLTWFENDGKQNWKRHDFVAAPTHLVTLDAADIDGDGDIDLVTGRMLFGTSGGRGEGLTLWTNEGKKQ